MKHQIRSRKQRILWPVKFILCVPHLILYFFSRNKKLIDEDITSWCKTLKVLYRNPIALTYYLSFYPELRTIFYYRIGFLSFIGAIILKPMPTSSIGTSGEIKGGMFFFHGFATSINPQYMGKNCMVWQMVTIGKSSDDSDLPILGDNVRVYTGSVVAGGVTIGDNSIIGANTVILKDVPSNCTVVGSPPRIIVENGRKVSREL